MKKILNKQLGPFLDILSFLDYNTLLKIRLSCKEIYENVDIIWKNYKLTNEKFAMILSRKFSINFLLKNKHFDPSFNDNYAIKWASYYGILSAVEKLLIDNRVDPSACKNFAIEWASANGHLEVVKALLKHNSVNPNDNNYSASRFANANKHFKIVEELLKYTKI